MKHIFFVLSDFFLFGAKVFRHCDVISVVHQEASAVCKRPHSQLRIMVCLHAFIVFVCCISVYASCSCPGSSSVGTGMALLLRMKVV